MKCAEVTENHSAGPIKPLTAQQGRLAALKRQKENASKALDAERKRQKVAKAQQNLQKTIAVKLPT